MTVREIEIIETGVLGDDIPVPAAAKVGDLVYVSGNIGNRHGLLELVRAASPPRPARRSSIWARPLRRRAAR